MKTRSLVHRCAVVPSLCLAVLGLGPACSKAAPEPAGPSSSPSANVSAGGLVLAPRGAKPEIAFDQLEGACDAHLAKFTGPNRTAGGGKCTATEVAIYQKDTTGNCLNCMFQRGCLDDTAGDADQECGDLGPKGITAGTEAQCVAALRCALGDSKTSSKVDTAPARGNTIASFCGTGANYSDCIGEIGPKGACVTEEKAGFPAAFNAATLVNNFAAKQYASGQANAMITCANINCKMCLD